MTPLLPATPVNYEGNTAIAESTLQKRKTVHASGSREESNGFRVILLEI
jgi:hypothetical protein